MLNKAAATGDLGAALNVAEAAFEPTHTYNMVIWGKRQPNDTPVRMIQEGLSASLFEDEKGNLFSALNEYFTLIKKEDTMSNIETLPRPGKMSGDRVHFTLTPRHMAKNCYVKLLDEVFGIKSGEYNRDVNLDLVCRPSQFARFIILRHTKYDESNDMAGLNMKLVSPKPFKPVNQIDCSTRANTAVGEIAA